jgi:hypothetical protein
VRMGECVRIHGAPLLVLYVAFASEMATAVIAAHDGDVGVFYQSRLVRGSGISFVRWNVKSYWASGEWEVVWK